MFEIRAASKISKVARIGLVGLWNLEAGASNQQTGTNQHALKTFTLRVAAQMG